MKSTKFPSKLDSRRGHGSSAEKNRGERIIFRLSAEEKAGLTEKAARRGLTLSRYCRDAAMRRNIPDHSPETRQYLRDLTGMANNLNQLARHVNTIRGVDAWALDALRFLADEVRNAKLLVLNI